MQVRLQIQGSRVWSRPGLIIWLRVSYINFYGHSPPFRWIIQEGLLSVTSESMCTKYWLTACSSLPMKKWLSELTVPPWPLLLTWDVKQQNKKNKTKKKTVWFLIWVQTICKGIISRQQKYLTYFLDICLSGEMRSIKNEKWGSY